MFTKNYRGGTITGQSEELVNAAISDMERSRARAAEARLKWGTDNREQMRRLCDSFPTLRGVPGTDPWDVLELLRWMLETGGPTAGSWCAARFVLQVWDFGQDWQNVAKENGVRNWRAYKPFNAAEAMARWDAGHRQAFLEWCQLPFFP